jgi:ATP/maltotriose-dependent transcriptional regulator MalT
LPEFTQREWQIVGLIADGHGNESIGSRLGISVETVKKNLSNLYPKLKVNTRLEVCVWFYKVYQSPLRTEDDSD